MSSCYDAAGLLVDTRFTQKSARLLAAEADVLGFGMTKQIRAQ